MPRNAMQVLLALLVVPMLGAQETKPSTLVLPAIGSSPETGLKLGMAVIRLTRAVGAARPSATKSYALGTAKRQFQASLERDSWSPDLGWRRHARLEILHFPQLFYGIGENAPDSAEERFTARTVQVQGKLQRRLSGSWYGLASARVVSTAIRDAEPGALGSGRLRGSDGGTLVQPGVGVSFDNRDDLLGPESGRLLDASFAVADRAWGSKFSTTRVVVDGRAYYRLAGGVIAGQAFLEMNGGFPSFDQMSLVGSDNVLRGYARGRYRDRVLAAAQLEWRAPIRGRWRYALFGGVGGISSQIQSVDWFVLPTWGGGIRFRPFKSERSSLRLDYARGRSGSRGLYISLDEAF